MLKLSLNHNFQETFFETNDVSIPVIKVSSLLEKLRVTMDLCQDLEYNDKDHYNAGKSPNILR